MHMGLVTNNESRSLSMELCSVSTVSIRRVNLKVGTWSCWTSYSWPQPNHAACLHPYIRPSFPQACQCFLPTWCAVLPPNKALSAKLLRVKCAVPVLPAFSRPGLTVLFRQISNVQHVSSAEFSSSHWLLVEIASNSTTECDFPSLSGSVSTGEVLSLNQTTEAALLVHGCSFPLVNNLEGNLLSGEIFSTQSMEVIIFFFLPSIGRALLIVIWSDN